MNSEAAVRDSTLPYPNTTNLRREGLYLCVFPTGNAVWHGLLAALLGLSGVACEAARIRAIERRARAVEAAIPLAVSARAREPVSARARVLVGADGVSIGGDGFFEERLVSIRDWRLQTTAPPRPNTIEVASLHRALARVFGRDGGPEEPRLPVSLVIHRDAPLSVWGPIYATMTAVDLAPAPIVAISGGLRVLHLVNGTGSPCPVPRIQIGPAGARVSADAQAIVPRPGACPSIARRGGRIDAAELASLLREIVGARPDCGLFDPPVPPGRERPGIEEFIHRESASYASVIVVIEPSPATTWQETIAVADAAADAGLSSVELVWLNEPLGSCEGAITPATLGVRLEAAVSAGR